MPGAVNSGPGLSAATIDRKADLQTTLDKQLKTIQELTGTASDKQKVDQCNRELHNRAYNLQGDIASCDHQEKRL